MWTKNFEKNDEFFQVICMPVKSHLPNVFLLYTQTQQISSYACISIMLLMDPSKIRFVIAES